MPSIRRDGGGFAIDTPAGLFRAGKIVIAAGHGTTKLAATLGLEAPIVPERGQLVVTERVAPILPIPASGVRQTRDGTIMIGTTHEAAPDLTTRATTANAVHIASRAGRPPEKIAPDADWSQ